MELNSSVPTLLTMVFPEYVFDPVSVKVLLPLIVTATTGNISESLSPTTQQQFADFDESLGFALRSGITLLLLLPGAEEPEH